MACGTLAPSTVRNSRPFQFLRQAVAPFRPEIAALAFSCFALVLRVAVSAGMPASALRSYCLAVGLAAIAVTALAKRRLWLDGPRLAILPALALTHVGVTLV